MDFFYASEKPVLDKKLIFYMGDSTFVYGYYRNNDWILENGEDTCPIKWAYVRD